jgi:hypothetical protein
LDSAQIRIGSVPKRREWKINHTKQRLAIKWQNPPLPHKRMLPEGIVNMIG